MRVLVVEDESTIADFLVRGLTEQGYAVDHVGDGQAALEVLATASFDAVVLDILLPKLDGLSVCTRMRARGDRTPVLMLTARDTVDDRVGGLDSGADDYLVKPFAFAELVARVIALGRRVPRERPPILERGDVRLDPARHEATRGGRELRLTPKEFGVLETLLAADGDAVSAEDLLRRVWDENIDPVTNTARMTVMTLRRKLGSPPFIETVKGAGYRV
jgi:DNA-binding response OmpR family regulator